jgi:hypothetical protein
MVVMLLTGCAEPTATRPVNLSGYSPEFKQGYTDGCQSAGARGQTRNERRYQKDSQYQQGWDDGYSVCQRR